MPHARQRTVRMTVDGYTRVCLTAIAVLLTVLVLGLWAERSPALNEAHAGLGKGIPDSGQQRQKMIEQLDGIAAKLDKMVKLLESGQAKVQVAAPPPKKEAPVAPPQPIKD